jgi:hypothetical protein
MRKLVAIPILAGAVVALAPSGGHQRGVSPATLRGYLDRMSMRYVAHPKDPDALVVTRSTNEHADRVDLYIDIRPDHTLVLTAYARSKDRFFNMSRASSPEKLFQKLLGVNHRAFATFFVDEQGDIGTRFTFTTEDGVGFDSFRIVATELLRIADEYAPILDGYMRKDEPAPRQ